MEEMVFEALKNKSHYNREDIDSLLILCDRLFTRNGEIASQLEKALGSVDIMQRRIAFYRKTTMREVL